MRLFLILWMVVQASVAGAAIACKTFAVSVPPGCATTGFRENLFVNGVYSTGINRCSSVAAGGSCSWQTCWTIPEDIPPSTIAHTVTWTGISDFTNPNAGTGLIGAVGGETTYVQGCANSNGCAATNIQYTFCITNTTAEVQRFQAYDNGSPLCGGMATPANGYNGTFMELPPGVGGCMRFVNPTGCGQGTTNVYVLKKNPGGTLVISSCGTGGSAYLGEGTTGFDTQNPIFGGWEIIGGGGGGGGGGSGGNTNTPPIVVGPPSTWDPTNGSPIVFGTNDLQSGFSALYDAITKGFAENSRNQNTMINNQNEQIGIERGGTNYSWQINTNVIQVSNAVFRSQMAITNIVNLRMLEVSNIALRTLETNKLYGNIHSNLLSGIAGAVGAGTATNINIGTVTSNQLSGVSNAIWSGIGTNVLVGNALSNLLHQINEGIGSLAGSTNGGGSGTNIFDDTEITNSIWATHRSLTNYYESLRSNVLSLADVPGSGTNLTAAQTAYAASDGPGVEASFNTALGVSIGDVPSGGGGGSGLTVSWMGHTINCDPVTRFPALATFSMTLWTLVLVMYFCYDVGKALWSATQTYASAQTGGVPDLNGTALGFGGNIAGLAVALAVPTVLIAIWVVAFSGIFSLVLSSFGLASGVASSLTPASLAWYVISAFFPVSLAVSLLWTRILLYITMAKLVFVSASISKYLFGR